MSTVDFTARRSGVAVLSDPWPNMGTCVRQTGVRR
jgi:hypothetical protein